MTTRDLPGIAESLVRIFNEEDSDVNIDTSSQELRNGNEVINICTSGVLDKLDETQEVIQQDIDFTELKQNLTEKYKVKIEQYLERLSLDEQHTQTKFDTCDNTLQDCTCVPENVQAVGMNVRGLNSNKAQLEELFQCKRKDNIILFLSEIFEPSQNLDLEGIKSYYLTRPPKLKSRRGGVAIAVPTKWDSMEIRELSHMQERGAIECLAVKIEDLKLICLSVYRPIGADYVSRNSFSEFLMKLTEILEIIHKKFEGYKTLLMGDINVDLLDPEADCAQKLVAELAGFGLVNNIHAPTRICETTATLIDHCWTDLNCTNATVLLDGVADHLGTYVQFETNVQQEQEQDRWGRKMNKAALKRIKAKLRKTDWSFIHNHSIPINEKWIKYETSITAVINECAPMKKHKQRQEKPPWYTKHLKAMKKKMDTWYMRMQTEKDRLCQNGKTTKQNYAYHRNRYKRAIKQAKLDHWETLFLLTSTSRQTWQLINKAMQREQTDDGMKMLRTQEGGLTADNTEKANIMNEFFANIGEKTANGIPPTDKQPLSYLNYLDDEINGADTFGRFTLTDQEEVEAIIKKMKPKANVMSNGINMKIIRECRQVLSHSLTHLLNESIQQNVFPAQLKIAEVVPLYKKGPKTEPTNYRPISLLDPFGKVYEKLIESQLRTFMEGRGHLSNNQHGYRTAHSCDSMIVAFLQEVSDSLQAGDVSVLILLDCSKAFDSISRPLLIEKLRRYGVRGGALSLITSYLNDRTQRVKIEETYSSVLACSTGVPQGSIFGPLLYIIYTNDVEVAIDAWSSLYADDNNSSHRAKTLPSAMGKAQDSLTRTEEWFRSNRVCVNGSKSKYIVVSRKGDETCEETLQIEGKQLQRVHSKDEKNPSTAFVGLHLNEKMDFEPHINATASRAMRNLRALAMVKDRLPKGAKLQIFHSLIQSYLCLNIMASGRAATKLVNKLQVIQNRALRIVENLPSRASCAEARYKNDILTIADQYEYTNCIWAIKSIAGMAPEAVDKIVEKSNGFGRNMQLMYDNKTYAKAKNLSPKDSIAKAWNKLEQSDRRHMVHVLSGEEVLPTQANGREPDRYKHCKNFLKKLFLEKAWNKEKMERS